MNRSSSAILSKGTERELQEKMYVNIALLNMIHPPSEDFKAVFKKDMFAKNNKAAFLHVIHYLLTVLNSEVAIQKLVSWPTCNIISRENKFRGEVLQYLNEINTMYEDANLPTMLSSHLLAPGGYRFINFMYQLSQLVLRENLRKTYGTELLERPKPSKSEIINKKAYENLIEYTGAIRRQTIKAKEKFERSFEYYKKEADKIVSDQNSVHSQLKEVQDKIEIEELKFKSEAISQEELIEKLKDIEMKSETVYSIVETYTECKNFVDHMKEYNFDGNGISDLSESLRLFTTNLKRQLSDLPTFTSSELENILEVAEKKKGELEKVQNDIQNQHQVLIEAMNTSKDLLKKILIDFED